MIKDTISNGSNHEDEDSCKATHNLYLKGFGSFITESDLEEHFERFGKVISARIFQRGMGKIVYGFVSFSRSYMAERALDHKPHYIRGQRIHVEQAEHEPGQYNKRGRHEPY